MSNLDMPFERGRETSRTAAREAEGKAPGDRERVLQFLIRRGRRGATDDETEDVLNMAHTTASARRRGLYKEGLVIWCGTTRKTRSGRPANVWFSAREARIFGAIPVELPETREERVDAVVAAARVLCEGDSDELSDLWIALQALDA